MGIFGADALAQTVNCAICLPSGTPGVYRMMACIVESLWGGGVIVTALKPAAFRCCVATDAGGGWDSGGGHEAPCDTFYFGAVL